MSGDSKIRIAIIVTQLSTILFGTLVVARFIL